jgi:hypothetical protein
MSITNRIYEYLHMEHLKRRETIEQLNNKTLHPFLEKGTWTVKVLTLLISVLNCTISPCHVQSTSRHQNSEQTQNNVS